MKKQVVFAMFALLLLSVPSFSAYLQTAYLSNDLIMSQQPGKGNMLLSLKYENTNANEVGYSTGNQLIWVRRNNYYSIFNVYTLRGAYGISDDLAVRLSVPYVHNVFNAKGNGVDMGIGVGDIKVEALYSIAQKLSLNAGIKTSSGKRIGETEANQLAVGTGGVEISLSLISEKEMNGIILKGLAGYVLRCPILAGNLYDPADNVIISCAAEMPATDEINYGAEIWARLIIGRDYQRSASDDGLVDNSDNSSISISPYITFKLSDDMMIKGVVDIPVAGSPNAGLGDIYPMSYFRGLNISVGFDWKV